RAQRRFEGRSRLSHGVSTNSKASSGERQAVQDLKEKLCYVARDFGNEMKSTFMTPLSLDGRFDIGLESWIRLFLGPQRRVPRGWPIHCSSQVLLKSLIWF
ncbi:hypothetical protein CRE_22280, partial [Caenorhabditis remanei]